MERAAAATRDSGRLKLAIWPAIVLLAASAAAASSGAAALKVELPSRLKAVVLQPPPPFEVRPSCPVITVSISGACPLPAIPAQPRTKRATIFLCSESLCGRGFHPGDTILLLATRADGSTFWRAVTDRSGNFRSALPAPLCRFAPVSLMAFDTHTDQSNRLGIPPTGCAVLTP